MAQSNMLTVADIENAKPEADGKAALLNDRAGLWVRVRGGADGTVRREFLFRYGGRSKTLGPWAKRPAPGCLTLAQARQEAAKLRPAHRGGDNPIQAQRDAEQAERERRDTERRLAELAPTVDGLFASWLTLYARPELAPATTKRHEGVWRHVSAAMGALKMADVRKAHLVAVLDSLTADGKPDEANKVRQLARQVFAWAVERDVLEASPFGAMKGRRKVTPRRRNLSFDEVRDFLHVRLPGVPNAPVMVAALRLILATACRPGEILSARWDWYDKRAGVLKLPAEATKNRRPHVVPLSDYAAAQIAALSTIRQGPFICPAARTEGARTRVEYLDKFVSDRQRPKDKKPLARRTSKQVTLFTLAGGRWRPHDLRRTAASRMGELGISPHVIEALLNHTQAQLVETYQRHDYLPERRAALAQWGAMLDRLEAGELPGAEVIDLSARRAKK